MYVYIIVNTNSCSVNLWYLTSGLTSPVVLGVTGPCIAIGGCRRSYRLQPPHPVFLGFASHLDKWWPHCEPTQTLSAQQHVPRLCLLAAQMYKIVMDPVHVAMVIMLLLVIAVVVPYVLHINREDWLFLPLLMVLLVVKSLQISLMLMVVRRRRSF